MTLRHRILMTTDAVGGVWQYACSLAGALGADGHEILLVVMGPEPEPDQRRTIESLSGVKLVASGLPLDWLETHKAPVHAAAAEIVDLARREKPTVIHLNSPLLAAAGAYPAPVIAMAHGCIGTWWEAARQGPLDPALAWHADMTATGLKRCDLAVAPTLAHAETLFRRYRLSGRPEVVHNGRQRTPKPPPLRPEQHAFTAGRLWDPVKNTDILDAVAKNLSVPFYAAGRTAGPNGENVRPRHLRLLGQLTEASVAQSLFRRPIFVSAASFEPFGLAVLEAALAGCPLILSDIPSFRELWDGAAIFVETHDVDAYATAMEACLADVGRCDRLSRAAWERARHYSVDAMAAAMLRLYDPLARRRQAA